MIRMFVRHPVRDYAAWRKVYDSVEELRRSHGVTSHGVFQSADDPNDVTVIHDCDDLDKARALAASDDLKAAMQRAGVAGAPTIWFTRPT